MTRDATYHKSAIQYNEELADFAEDLSKRLEDEEVSKWAHSVSKQHRFHAGRHKKALSNLENGVEPEEDTPVSGKANTSTNPTFKAPAKKKS